MGHFTKGTTGGRNCPICSRGNIYVKLIEMPIRSGNRSFLAWRCPICQFNRLPQALREKLKKDCR